MRIFTSAQPHPLANLALGDECVAAGCMEHYLSHSKKSGLLEVWSLCSGECVRTQPIQDSLMAVAIDAQNQLYVGERQQEVAITQLSNGRTWTPPPAKLNAPSSFAVSFDGRYLCRTAQWNQNGCFGMWQRTATTFECIWEDEPANFGWFDCPIFSPDASYMAIAESDTGGFAFVIRHPDSIKPLALWQFEGTENVTHRPFAFTITNQGLLLSLTHRRVQVRTVTSTDAYQEIRNPSRKKFTAIAVHPSGKWFATTDAAGIVRTWELPSLRPLETFDWNIGPLCSIAFAPNGLLAAVGSDDGRVLVWDVA